VYTYIFIVWKYNRNSSQNEPIIHGKKIVIAKIIEKLIQPLILLILFIKFKNIWAIKKYIMDQEIPKTIFVAAYDGFFSRCGGWISYSAEFSSVPCFPHGYFGIFISSTAKIGSNVVIFQQVTIGSNSLAGNKKSGSPTIGDNVYIGAGAKIIGNVVVGDNCRIGANAVVYQDMPANSVAVSSPTKIIQKQNLDNRFITYRNGEKVFFKDGLWIGE